MLTDILIKGFKPRAKPYKVADEKGLFLLVKPNGSKLWRFKYYLSGIERGPLALGVYPEITLKRARDKRDAARAMLDQNIDPELIAERRSWQRSARTRERISRHSAP
jgi:hypothetical protein